MTDILEIWVCGSPFTEFEKVRASTKENEDLTINNTQKEGVCQLSNMGFSTQNLVNHQLLSWIASLLALVRRTNSYDFYLTELFPTIYTLHSKHKLNVPEFPRMSDSTSLEEIQLKTS